VRRLTAALEPAACCRPRKRYQGTALQRRDDDELLRAFCGFGVRRLAAAL